MVVFAETASILQGGCKQPIHGNMMVFKRWGGGAEMVDDILICRWEKGRESDRATESDEVNLNPPLCCFVLCGPWQTELMFPPELALLSATPHSTSSPT